MKLFSSSILVVALVSLGLVCSPTSAQVRAQVRASERATVSQQVDGTIISVDFSRPRARGRELFGGIVPWGEVWTPGADWATNIEFSRDVTVNGHAVRAGKYSIWMVPRPDEWEVHFNVNPYLFHNQAPDPASSFVSFSVTPETASYVEPLSWYFPDFAPDGTTLRMHWGAQFVTLDIQTEPSTHANPLTESEAAPYLGRFDVIMTSSDGTVSPNIEVKFVAREGKIFWQSPQLFDAELVPTSTPHTFDWVILRDGEVFTTEGVPILFDFVDGRAEAFKVLAYSGHVWISGARKD